MIQRLLMKSSPMCKNLSPAGKNSTYSVIIVNKTCRYQHFMYGAEFRDVVVPRRIVLFLLPITPSQPKQRQIASFPSSQHRTPAINTQSNPETKQPQR